MSKTTFTSDQTAQIQREAQAWVVRLDSGLATSRDAQAFRLWCAQSRTHAQAFAQAREVWHAVNASLPTSHQAWSRQAPASVGRRAFLGAALSVGIGYLVVRPPGKLWPAWSDLTADYRTATGEQRAVSLAGQGTVQMNTQTRINVRHAADAGAGIEL
ncbi:MAG TPA: iron dicitrate transport regulator FecR, partial [Pusillimonas sp.]|nr:iron dicitrate transport regulator FecR [Pusillimonas sp.]